MLAGKRERRRSRSLFLFLLSPFSILFSSLSGTVLDTLLAILLAGDIR
jgi:hypothetical protein